MQASSRILVEGESVGEPWQSSYVERERAALAPVGRRVGRVKLARPRRDSSGGGANSEDRLKIDCMSQQHQMKALSARVAILGAGSLGVVQARRE